MYLTVNTLATIYLPEDTPERIREILASRPEIDVRNGSEARLRVDDRTFPLVIAPGVHPWAQATTKLLAELVGPVGGGQAFTFFHSSSHVLTGRRHPRPGRAAAEPGTRLEDGAGGL